jgi:uncharacterized protein YdaU (DUF1376 family)
MPLFFGDFLASTVFWKGDEKALYLLLLGYQWAGGPLPADLSVLAATVAYDKKNFLQLWKRVGQKFERTTQGLVNSRLESVRQRSAEISAARSAVGSKGGRASGQSRGKQTASNDEPIASSLLPKAESKSQANGNDLPKQKGTIQSNPSKSKSEEAYQEEEGQWPN